MSIKIGVFDSGIGGLTVLSELRRQLGFMDYVYLGDTANVPYGNKSPAQIEKLALDCVARLKAKKIDALVIACNTVASRAIPAIQELMDPIPVFGVVEPGIEAALEALSALQTNERQDQTPILVFATRATVDSQAYGQALKKNFEASDYSGGLGIPIFEQACPLLVPMIEEGWIDHSILHATIQEYVKPYLEQYDTGVAVLGCTHYPWIHSAFEKALPGWTVVNSARSIVKSLKKQEWVQAESNQQALRKGSVEWIFTDAQAVAGFARLWIETSISV